jgi:hypothetical protein
MQPKPDCREVYQKFARIAQRYCAVWWIVSRAVRCAPFSPI